MEYLPATVFTIGVLAIVILGCWLCLKADAIVNWFLIKGSRITYYLPAGKKEIYRTSFPCRHHNDRKYIDGSVIEVNTGLFLRRSAIYGPAAKNWQIARVSLGNNAQGGFGADWVDLVDRSSLLVEQALYLINKYSSLQAMLDRIVELEQQVGKLQDKLAWTESHRKTWLASLEALRQEIESDRQRYRSQAAQNIRVRVGQVLEHAKSLGQIPDDDSIDAIKRLWIVRDGGTPPFRKFGGQVWGY